jgi:hypothetical protein
VRNRHLLRSADGMVRWLSLYRAECVTRRRYGSALQTVSKAGATAEACREPRQARPGVPNPN